MAITLQFELSSRQFADFEHLAACPHRSWLEALRDIRQCTLEEAHVAAPHQQRSACTNHMAGPPRYDLVVRSTLHNHSFGLTCQSQLLSFRRSRDLDLPRRPRRAFVRINIKYHTPNKIGFASSIGCITLC